MKRIIAMLIVLPMAFSCSFLDEYNPNATTKGNFYLSEDDIMTSLYGVYSSLTAAYWYGANSFYFTDNRANSTSNDSAGTNGGIYFQFFNFTLTEENGCVDSRYASIYKTISRVNKLLEHLDDVEYADERTRDIYEAEALFLRALSYFHLVTEWGDVPLVLKELTTLDEVNAHNFRRPKKDVYQAVFDDLKKVVNSPLQNTCPADMCGRASKAAAYALAGKAWLHYALDDSNASEKDASLEQAIANLNEAWKLRTFGNLSDIAYSDLWNLKTQKSCPEAIFQINHIQGNESLGSSWNYVFGPKTTGITSMASGSEYNFTTTQVYGLFDSKDIRRTYLRKFTKNGLQYYHTMKYADVECGVNGYGGNNWMVLRYADVALMLAEAHYWSGDEPTAKTWLNMVRKRAGLQDWDGSDLRQGIYDERLFEFIHEGLRWQDMLRMYDDEEMVSHYSAINENFTKQDLLLPIPYNERILNPEGLYQNPEY